MEKNNKYNTNLCCDPTFLGTREDPNKYGSFYNINLNNFTIEDFLGALSRGIIEELYSHYKKIDAKRETVVASGGLIKKNRVFQNIIKSIFNKELLLTGCNQEAALGAAVAAIKGLEIIEDFTEAGKFIKYQ